MQHTATPHVAALLGILTGFSHAQTIWPELRATPPTHLSGLAYDEPFFPGATYNADIPTPDSVIGFRLGDKPVTHAQVEAVIKAIASKGGRARLFEYGTTHEGRTLYNLFIASEENISRLDALKQDYANLSDPRKIAAPDADRLADTLPALAWMAYCIHGDEMSGTDASLALAHHLAASKDEDVRSLLRDVVVVIDPDMNPDGRDRCITSVRENRTVQPSIDSNSVIHSGIWPTGRMNHYLFDLNRDWIFGTQPETRGRIAWINAWRPHYLVESHEQGSFDTFLFQPAREPYNPNAAPQVRKWMDKFAADQAAAFDSFGWRYYMGEWNEEWYPGYTGSWAGLRNIVDNLYEQAAIVSDAIRRPEGTLEAYREAVHKQLVSSVVNLRTLASNRREILRDYLAERRANVSKEGPYSKRVLAVLPTANTSRQERLLDLMRLQGFEVFSAVKEFPADGKDQLGLEFMNRTIPAGTILIPLAQPEARLVAAMTEFDPRMSRSFLTDERRELLRMGQSKLYDITGWNITMLFGLEACELTTGLPASAKELSQSGLAPPQSTTPLPASRIGYVIDGSDDRSVSLAARLMEMGVKVRAAEKPFRFDGRDYARGSIIVEARDNPHVPGDLAKTVAQTAGALSLSPGIIKSGAGPGDLPDLGGSHFVLLEQPRIALMGREPFNPYSYGQTWYAIDHELGIRASYIDFSQFEAGDLRRYNVLVFPDGGGEVIGSKFESLKPWIQSGGTLIAFGSTAAAIAAEKGIGGTRLLPDVLNKLDEFRMAWVREWEGWTVQTDVSSIWSHGVPDKIEYPWSVKGDDDKPGEDELKRRDSWRRLFSPTGVILAGRVDDRSFLTMGCGPILPVIFSGDNVFLSPQGVQAPIRLGVFRAYSESELATHKAQAEAKKKKKQASEKGPPKNGGTTDEGSSEDEPENDAGSGWSVAPPNHELRLRMAGLLWPEAADRIANSAFVTREQIGNGQVILFATDPNFRAATLGTKRVFNNAVILGPGMGARHPVKP